MSVASADPLVLKKGFAWKRLFGWFVVTVAVIALGWGGSFYWIDTQSEREIYVLGRPQTAIERLQRWQWVSFGSMRWKWLQAEAYRKQNDFQHVKQFSDSAALAGAKTELAMGPLWLLKATTGFTDNVRDNLAVLLVQYGSHRTEVYAALVQGFVSKGDTTQAAKLIRLWKDDVESDELIHYWEGILSEANYKLDDAAASLRKAIEINPNFLDAHQELAELLMEQTQFDAARIEFEWLLDHGNTDPHTICSHARALLNLGLIDEAAEELVNIKDYSKLQSKEIALMAEANFESGRIDAAVEMATLLVNRWPNAFPYLELLARCEAKRGNTARSAELFKESEKNRKPELEEMTRQLNAEPDNLDLKTQVGIMSMNYNDPAVGAGYLTYVIHARPFDILAHKVLAEYNRRECKIDTAMSHERIVRELEKLAQNPKDESKP